MFRVYNIMGYEIEISYNVKIPTHYLTNVIAKTKELADTNYCQKHFQFTQSKNPNNHNHSHSHSHSQNSNHKNEIPTIVFCFESERLTEMTTFLKEVIAKYKKKTRIESVYDVDARNIIYASPNYVDILETSHKEDYIYRRQTRSFSETDYFILRDILKKNY
jgi:hypothetical protein